MNIMLKMLLYLLAAVLSFSVWTCIGTFMIPFVCWIFGFRIVQFSISIAVIICICSVIYLLTAVILRIKRKLKILWTCLFFIVPASVSITLACLADDRYDRTNASWINNYYLGDEWVFDRFGNKITYLGYSRCRHNGDYIYIYKGDYIGTIFDTNQGKTVLEETSLEYGGEIFEENGLYGIALKENGQIIVQPRYEALFFCNKGFIGSKRNGKYGLLSPLGQKIFDSEYDDFDFVSEFHQYRSYICFTGEKENRNVVYLFDGYSNVDELFSTEYSVADACKEDRFIIRDDDNSYYRYCIVDDRGTELSDWYYDIKYESEKFYGRRDRGYGWKGWEEITLGNERPIINDSTGAGSTIVDTL